jgi:hypothetical protein
VEDEAMGGCRFGFLLGLVLAAGGLTLAGPRPARADTVIFFGGDMLTGQVELQELTLLTAGGVVRLGRREIREVNLGNATGDSVGLVGGHTLGGQVDQASYTIRLPSGQQVVIPRGHAAVIRLQAR